MIQTHIKTSLQPIGEIDEGFHNENDRRSLFSVMLKGQRSQQRHKREEKYFK